MNKFMGYRKKISLRFLLLLACIPVAEIAGFFQSGCLRLHWIYAGTIRGIIYCAI